MLLFQVIHYDLIPFLLLRVQGEKLNFRNDKDQLLLSKTSRIIDGESCTGLSSSCFNFTYMFLNP